MYMYMYIRSLCSSIMRAGVLTIQHALCYLYKCKNEVGCRDDTVPKTVDTRRHCEEE